MKLDELRGILSQYDQERTARLAVELYKVIPKREREDNGLDDFIRTLASPGTTPKLVRPVNTQAVDFSALRQETETFVDYAAAGYYFQPNRFVAKSARSKWRFTARRLIKSLIAVKGENTDEAALLLVEIWRALCYTCGSYIFPTDTPFSAVGYTQPNLLDVVLAKLFYTGVTNAKIQLAVWTVLESQVDRETLPSDLQLVLIGHLKTADMKQAALDECDFFTGHFKDPASCPYASQRFRLTYSREWFTIDHSDDVTNLCAELYLRISIALGETDSGVEYFKSHFNWLTPEVSLFCLLNVISQYADESPTVAKTWVTAYDDAVKRGISPRPQLVKQRAAFELTGQ